MQFIRLVLSVLEVVVGSLLSFGIESIANVYRVTVMISYQ
jgi:hypothetical protein